VIEKSLPVDQRSLLTDDFSPVPQDDFDVIVDDQPGDPLMEQLDAELPEPPLPFDGNLAERLTDDELGTLISHLEECFAADLGSRKDWEQVYTDGLDLLGIKNEDRSFPWKGACGVTHPMILESAVRFQSKASVRLFPAKGPAAVRVFGRQDDETLAASRRVEDDLNYYCTERMSEYFPDTEQLLFALPVAGSAFRKIYFDANLNRPAACFIPASDFVMPAAFPNLETCPRYAQRLRMSLADVRRLQTAGYYLDSDIEAAPVDLTEAEQKEATISGIEPSSDHNELATLIEMHTDLVVPGFEDPDGVPLPYVVTWEKNSSHCLAIRRNWREEDPRRKKILHFVHYRYVPGLDSYGYGLIHLIGGISKSSTSILRQLVDAGTLSNLPGGLKARTLRIKGDDTPIAPGEWRDVDVPAGKISDGLHQLPYKEPSGVLFALYNSLVQEGKEFASIADLDISAASANAPVGTILALLERASEVITAVQARMHQTFKQELNLIADCIRRYDSDAYEYPVDGAEQTVKRQDYSRRWAIRPVSDPSSSTTAQRVMQYQAAMQFAQQAPQIYDVPKLHRQMLANLGIDPPEDLVPDKKAQPMDPVSENMAIVNSKPVEAYEYQDHDAHIGVHMAMAQDQELQGMLSQSPTGPAVQAAMAAHIAEHVAFAYRRKIEQQLGVPLPPLGEELPPEVERRLSAIEAPAAAKLAQQRAAEAQQKQNDEKQQDPVFQLEQQRVANEARRIANQAQAEQGKLQVATAKVQSDAQASQIKAQSEATKAQAATQKTLIEAQAAQTSAETERAKALSGAQNEQQRLAISEQQTEANIAVNADRLDLDHQRLRAEILDMRAQLELALKRLDMEAQRNVQ
jgi:hypothetical protein